jgi:AraC family transcriptional regulator, transcriptional activator of the genes for pyochelin and ferripyochelin receptors
MPTIVKSLTDDTLLHSNNYTASDFNSPELIGGTKQVESPGMKGSMSQWFFDGIRISHSNLIYSENSAVEWTGSLDAVTLGFNLRGNVVIEQKGLNRSFSFSNQQHNVLYAGTQENIMRNECSESEMFIVQFNRDAFLRLTENTTDNLLDFRDKILTGKPVMLSPQNALIDQEIGSIIKSVLNCPYSGGTKKMFFLSKAIELLVLQARIFDRSKNTDPVHCKSDYDKERILFAKEYLEQHYDVPPTLTSLAQVAGINEFKLKKGFKEVLGTTAFGYLTNYKMEMAKTRLAEKQTTISQLAYELGYSSPQHFSAAFKNKFGYPPKQFK